MEKSTECPGDCEMRDSEELELGKPSVGPTENDQRKRSSCSVDSADENEGSSHHAPLVMTSYSLPTTDEGSSVALEARKRMKTHAGNSFGSSSEIDLSARGSLQLTEGREASRNAAASLGRPPRYPIGPPPAQRAEPDSTRPYVYMTSPNGRRVYGFWYADSAGESKIMCVCHGEFFTPAQFVEHGGGGVVEDPNKHIIVTPFPFAS